MSGARPWAWVREIDIRRLERVGRCLIWLRSSRLWLPGEELVPSDVRRRAAAMVVEDARDEFFPLSSPQAFERVETLFGDLEAAFLLMDFLEARPSSRDSCDVRPLSKVREESCGYYGSWYWQSELKAGSVLAEARVYFDRIDRKVGRRAGRESPCPPMSPRNLRWIERWSEQALDVYIRWLGPEATIPSACWVHEALSRIRDAEGEGELEEVAPPGESALEPSAG